MIQKDRIVSDFYLYFLLICPFVCTFISLCHSMINGQIYFVEILYLNLPKQDSTKTMFYTLNNSNSELVYVTKYCIDQCERIDQYHLH